MKEEWQAYELRPGLPSEGIPREAKPGEINGFRPHFYEYSEEVGLRMQRPRFTPSSRSAMEVAEYAKEQGKFSQFHLAVFRAYWEEGKNIGLRNVLLELAQENGLNQDEVERCLNEGLYRQTVMHQSECARRMGINAVPAFIIGGSLIEGIQPYSVFENKLKAVM